jgi:hypothetical protein
VQASARVDLQGGGSRGPASRLALRSMRAPLIAVAGRAATPDGRGNVRLRLECDARWKAWCGGSVTLLGADGARLGSRALTLHAVGPRDVTIALSPAGRTRVRAARGAESTTARRGAPRVHVRIRSTAPAGRPVVRERRIALVAR